MILEMHCHTAEHSSCSNVSAADLVQHNFDLGLHGTVLTDHHYLWTQEEIGRSRPNLKVSDYYLILSGQEVATPELGDVLVYGADVSIEKGTSLESIRKNFPNAAIIWAHPYRHENIPPCDKLFYPLINGIEIFSSNHTVAESSRGLRDWHNLRFTAIAGTDSHALSYAGLYPTIFDHPVSTVTELAGEIRAGRCRPFLEEIPHSGTSSTRVTEITVGTGKSGDIREKYVIKRHKNLQAWHSAARTTHIMDEISRHGFEKGRFRVPKPMGNDRESLTIIPLLRSQYLQSRPVIAIRLSNWPPISASIPIGCVAPSRNSIDRLTLLSLISQRKTENRPSVSIPRNPTGPSRGFSSLPRLRRSLRHYLHIRGTADRSEMPGAIQR